ncbi:MAG: PIN domain-containing protein [Verrucomicrobiota bacterium]|jgi:predicted nucleic acid-binding protein
MIYLDTSCLLKLLWDEPESAEVVDALGRESAVVISVLAELETLVQLNAAHLGGEYGLPQLRRLEAQLAILRNREPYEFRTLPGSVFQAALRQHRNAAGIHCRTLDRLHLAAMEELKISRLMTHDEQQATAAIAARFAVVRPGRH